MVEHKHIKTQYYIIIITVVQLSMSQCSIPRNFRILLLALQKHLTKTGGDTYSIFDAGKFKYNYNCFSDISVKLSQMIQTSATKTLALYIPVFTATGKEYPFCSSSSKKITKSCRISKFLLKNYIPCNFLRYLILATRVGLVCFHTWQKGSVLKQKLTR